MTPTKKAAPVKAANSETENDQSNHTQRTNPLKGNSPRIITVDFSNESSGGKEKFRQIIERCRLSHSEKKQIEFVSLEGMDLTISLPYEWQGRTETLLTLRDRIFDAAEKVNIAIGHIPAVFREGSLRIPDMAEAALDGWLGNLCRERLSAFPRAYAWPALVAAASVLVPNMCSKRTNIYAALVGDKGTGKSAVRDYCFKLLGIKGDQVIDAMAGSAEGLFTEGLDVAGKAKIFSPDELSHTLAKAAIDRASLPYVLSRAYNDTAFHLIISKQKHLPFNCRLSIVGGIVESNFDQSFNHSTTGGLHDRFIFGLHPTDCAPYDYRPFTGKAAEFGDPSPVEVEDDVWAELSHWRKIDKLDHRAVENALRVATICASFEGKEELTANDLHPAFAFAQYQTDIKRLLSPNEGVNLDAQCRVSILKFLTVSKGGWVKVRDLRRRVNANRYGTMFDRVLNFMSGTKEIDMEKREKEGGGTPSVFVRIASDDE